MAREDKSLLSGLNLQVAGVGHLGVTGKVTLPKMDFEVVDDISTGKLKTQTMDIEIKQYSKSVLGLMLQNNLNPNARVPLLLKGNIKKAGADVPLIITAKGEIHEVNDGSLEENKEVSRTIKIKLDFYNKIVDGVPEVVYDRLNEILMVEGVDLLAQYRQNVM